MQWRGHGGRGKWRGGGVRTADTYQQSDLRYFCHCVQTTQAQSSDNRHVSISKINFQLHKPDVLREALVYNNKNTSTVTIKKHT